jgi:hypothetical protein
LPVLAFYIGIQYQKTVDALEGQTLLSDDQQAISKEESNISGSGLANWKTYDNARYGFSFEYPRDFSVREVDTGGPQNSRYGVLIDSPKTEEFMMNTSGESTDEISISPVITSEYLHEYMSFSQPILATEEYFSSEQARQKERYGRDSASMTYLGQVKAGDRTGFKFTDENMFIRPYVIFKNDDGTWFLVTSLALGQEPYDTIVSTLRFDGKKPLSEQ